MLAGGEKNTSIKFKLLNIFENDFIAVVSVVN